MGIVLSASEVARNLKGVHLYHYVLSNCSQRCRLALELKGVDWRSHHMDLTKKEHLAPDYVDINPNGVVPTLVHNGVVVIESNDIIAYIDEHFAGDTFMPDDPEDRYAVRNLIESSNGVQDSIKTLSHHYLFQGRRNQTGLAEIAEMEGAGANPNLVSFLRDFVLNAEAWKTRVDNAHRDVARRLIELDDRVNQTNAWLSGPRYGLADISWSVNYYRLLQCRLDMTETPLFEALGVKLIEHPAFFRAVIDYQP